MSLTCLFLLDSTTRSGFLGHPLTHAACMPASESAVRAARQPVVRQHFLYTTLILTPLVGRRKTERSSLFLTTLPLVSKIPPVPSFGNFIAPPFGCPRDFISRGAKSYWFHFISLWMESFQSFPRIVQFTGQRLDYCPSLPWTIATVYSESPSSPLSRLNAGLRCWLRSSASPCSRRSALRASSWR